VFRHFGLEIPEMSRKRVWEVGAMAALLLAMAAAMGGYFFWRERQRQLNQALTSALDRYREYSEAPTPNQYTIIRSLVRRGANVHTRGSHGLTALAAAAHENDAAFVEELLNRGATAEARISIGWVVDWTAMHCAAEASSSRAIDVLLAHGADVDARSRLGQTPLSISVARGDAMIARQLASAGANIEAADTNGETVLMHAVQNNDLELVKTLLACGADIHAQDSEGRTVCTTARRGVRLEIQRLIEQSDGDH
jgi:ankyrin repeat protein